MIDRNSSEQIEIESMKLVLSGLQKRGLPVSRIISALMRHFSDLAMENVESFSCYKTAAYYILAYLGLGFGYMEHKSVFDHILNSAGYSDACIAALQKKNPSIIINRAQIRALIGKWPASRYNSHTIRDAVDEIFSLCMEQKTGSYNYYTAKKEGSYTALYQLTVDQDYILFQDVYRNRFYTLTLPT